MPSNSKRLVWKAAQTHTGKYWVHSAELVWLHGQFGVISSSLKSLGLHANAQNFIAKGEENQQRIDPQPPKGEGKLYKILSTEETKTA